MTARPYVLGDITWKAVRETGFEVAVLPWGATEAHNTHLPYATDSIATGEVATRAAQLAWDAGARVLILPLVPYGVQTGQLDIPFCLNLNPSTQSLMLRDLAQSLDGQGVRKLVILNGHGGNDFRQIIREIQPGLRLFLCTVNWYAVVDRRTYFSDLGDHAGEAETSALLHLASDLVRPLAEAGTGAARRWKIRALREGWAWAPRQWTRVTDDTGVGDPRAATPEKGARYVGDAARRIADFFIELAAADPDDLYA